MAPRSVIGLTLAAGSAAALLVGAPASPHREPVPEGRAPTPTELLPAVEAAFPRESYAQGSTAKLVISNKARGLKLQVFHAGPERIVTRSDSTMNGVPVTPKVAIGSSRGRKLVTIRIGDWSSGLYFARLSAADGLVGFAPFVVRPRRLGEHRVAVVLPTLTWQAYNLRDEDRDGRGDSWYADWRTKTVRLGRPYLSRGVPYNFRRYDLPFLHWLAWTGRDVDLLSQSDLEAAVNSRALADAYDLIVFPGHHEYVTTREYDLVEGYRNLGGNLMFLSANNFFWQVVRRGQFVTKTELSARSETARGCVDRSAVPRKRQGTAPAVDRSALAGCLLDLRRDRTTNRIGTRERRRRDRPDDARVAAERPGARRDSEPLRTWDDRADDVLRDAQGSEGVRGGRLLPHAPGPRGSADVPSAREPLGATLVRLAEVTGALFGRQLAPGRSDSLFGERNEIVDSTTDLTVVATDRAVDTACHDRPS